MIQLAIFSFLVGAVFGLRFKVIAVLPLMLIGGFAISVASWLQGQTLAAGLVTFLAFAAAMQAGYLFGSLTRFTVVAVRAARAQPARLSPRTTR
ncbi:MAG: hypothetical protein JWQ94_1072 [Tardiphaga sp.]|nr:hypothetical protein [Tardiphaga sp.]